MHRLKLKVIEDEIQVISPKILFFDTHTIMHKNPENLLASIDKNSVILHTFERNNPCPEMKGFATVLAGPLTYEYSKKSKMYNNGVMELA